MNSSEQGGCLRRTETKSSAILLRKEKGANQFKVRTSLDIFFQVPLGINDTEHLGPFMLHYGAWGSENYNAMCVFDLFSYYEYLCANS